MIRLRFLLMLLAGALMTTGCGFDVYKLPLPGGADTGDKPMTVTVEFADVLDLVPQSTVKVADVTVGKVKDIQLKGLVAEVELEMQGDVDLPANARAEIRQTSLLGEKFVSLAPPTTEPPSGRLEDDAVIPLERSGRNPEIEEVLSALSLILNGGGVAQLKTIAHELNVTFEGNETPTRSVLRQLGTLMNGLEKNKGDIVHAIEAVNRLSISLNGQMDTIDLALEELPGALDSLDRQRDDLIKMLEALQDLSDVGVRVIKASKADTIEAFRLLRPVLKGFADAGDDLPNSLQMLFTFPFTDSVVGRDPQAARDLPMGDYQNLAINLDLDIDDLLANPPSLPSSECVRLGGQTQLPPLTTLCEGALAALQECFDGQDAASCSGIPAALVDSLCAAGELPGLCPGSGPSESGGLLEELVGGLLPRPAPGGQATSVDASFGALAQLFDPDLVQLYLPGVAQ